MWTSLFGPLIVKTGTEQHLSVSSNTFRYLQQKPEGKWCMQRDGAHSCWAGGEEMEKGSSLQLKGAQSHGCRRQPARHHSVGLIHSDCDMLSCLWGKTSTVALLIPRLPLLINPPSSSHIIVLPPTTTGSVSGALMKPGWGLMLRISGDRRESFQGSWASRSTGSAWLRAESCRPLSSHVGVCGDVTAVCTRMSEQAGGGGQRQRGGLWREVASAGDRRHGRASTAAHWIYITTK